MNKVYSIWVNERLRSSTYIQSNLIILETHIEKCVSIINITHDIFHSILNAPFITMHKCHKYSFYEQITFKLQLRLNPKSNSLNVDRKNDLFLIFLLWIPIPVCLRSVFIIVRLIRLKQMVWNMVPRILQLSKLNSFLRMYLLTEHFLQWDITIEMSTP